jgi:hypothetical protein
LGMAAQTTRWQICFSGVEATRSERQQAGAMAKLLRRAPWPSCCGGRHGRELLRLEQGESRRPPWGRRGGTWRGPGLGPPFDSEMIFLKHKMTQHHWQREGQDSWRGGLKTRVKTHTSETSGSQLAASPTSSPLEGSPRQVSTLHDKSPPRTTSLRPTREVRLRLVCGPGHTTQAKVRAPPPTRVGERFPTPCKYNSWRPCKQLTPNKSLNAGLTGWRPSNRHQLPLCHKQAQPEALKHPLQHAQI